MVEAGIGHVILARRVPSGALGCGFFLVDLPCLGVKDAYHRELAPSDLDERIAELEASGQTMVAIDPVSAKALLRDAVAFADRWGMEPAKAHRRTVALFDGIDAAAATERFTFGREGQGIFIPGPNESMSRIREIEQRLRRALGEDGWDMDVSPRDRAVKRGIVDSLGRMRPTPGDGAVIGHEGSTEPRES